MVKRRLRLAVIDDALHEHGRGLRPLARAPLGRLGDDDVGLVGQHGRGLESVRCLKQEAPYLGGSCLGPQGGRGR